MIKAGELLILEHGDYSDFVYVGPLRVLKDIDERAILGTFREEWKPDTDTERWRTDPGEKEFIGWLVKRGYVEAMDVATWALTGYYGVLEARPLERDRNGGKAA